MTEAVVAGRKSMKVELDEGQTISWCACGRSAKQPFCDGSHKGTGFKSVKYTAPEAEIKSFCMCKRTKTPPFCDGSHKELPADE